MTAPPSPRTVREKGPSDPCERSVRQIAEEVIEAALRHAANSGAYMAVNVDDALMLARFAKSMGALLSADYFDKYTLAEAKKLAKKEGW